MAEPDLELIDLRERRDEELLDALYRELFLPNFPDPDEGEDPSIWAPLLWGEPDSSQPVLHALVAGENLTSPHGRQLMGLVLCEYYRRSSCGLLSYVATRPGLRRRGLGRRLVERAVGTLRADAAADGHELRAFFGEVHDPAKVAPSEDVFDPTSRLEVMERLGARLVPVSYVQPELGPGLKRSDRLLLVAFPIDGPARELPAQTVRDFLHDLYRALGVADPDGDADYARMRAELDAPTVGLSPVRAERPALSFGKYAIALHFALVPRGDAPVDVGESDINFDSFERDMLSYSYRKEPRLFSSREEQMPENVPRTVELRFPRRLEYEAEGEQVQLICPASPGGSRRRQLDVKASRTMFGSGVSILHLVLVPADSEAASLTEYDLVKIAKLWERGEGVDTWEELDKLIAVGAPGGGGSTKSVKAYAEWVFRTNGLSLDGPRVGTLELLTEEEEWERIWEAKTSGADEPAAKLVSVGGIVQCLLDFTRISADELEDVFAPPLVFDENGLLGIHKGTLLSIATADRVYEQAAPSIGMSPYLLLSQAVLLHNEIQLERASDAYIEVMKRSDEGGEVHGRAERPRRIQAAWRFLRRQRSNKEARLLAETERAMHRALNVYYLPNVFQYEGERRAYETGATSRALADHREDLREKLREVHRTWEHENARRREFAEDVMNVVLVFITAIGLHTVFEDVSIWYFVGAAVIFAAFYIRRRKM